MPSPVSSPVHSHVSAQGQDRSRIYTSFNNDEGVPDSNDSDEEISKPETKKLDVILSRLTSAFPLFVLGSALSGFLVPSTLEWVNRGNLISLMLACVMMGTGMTLEKRDFTEVLARNFASVPAGVLCQFCIMPATAFVVGRTMLLHADPVLGPALFLGLALVGCSPGGTASNLVSLIAKADVALSVLLTSCSTILAAVATPLLVKLLVGSTVQLSGMALCSTTARVVLMPVIVGMFLNAMAPDFSRRISRFTPFASVLLVSLICGGVVSDSASSLFDTSSTFLLPLIIGSVLSLHTIGFLLGYLVPRLGLRYSEKTARTISIETGMQNSALAVVLAQSIGAHPLAALPGALSATTHSCLGSILAVYWRYVDSTRRASNKKETNESLKE
jgi:BASS family bile acid:Na+ symporter